MKKLFFMTALLFASILTTTAQDGGRSRVRPNQTEVTETSPEKTFSVEAMANKETRRQTKRFGLTPDQIEKAKAINLIYCQQRLDVKAEIPLLETREAVANRLKEIRMAQYDELKAILTPEQQAKLVKPTEEMGPDGMLRDKNNGMPKDN